MPVKKIEGAATVEEIEKEIQVETIKKSPKKKRVVRIILAALTVVAVCLVGIDIFRPHPSQPFVVGTGDVSGKVVNAKLNPVQAEIFVLKKELSAAADNGGQFVLSGVPSGDNILIVVWQGMGKEVPVTIKPGETISIGLITVEETQLPPEKQP